MIQTLFDAGEALRELSGYQFVMAVVLLLLIIINEFVINSVFVGLVLIGAALAHVLNVFVRNRLCTGRYL